MQLGGRGILTMGRLFGKEILLCCKEGTIAFPAHSYHRLLDLPVNKW